MMLIDYSKLNPPQLQAVQDTEGPVMVFAGAGSGKTRTLTYRVAYMIEEKKIPAHKILAITFTNKATKEMKNRLYQLIGPLASSTHISTFHSLCARILRSEITLLGYSKYYEIIDEDDQLKALKEAMKEANIDIKRFSPKGLLSKISNFKNGVGDLIELFKKPYQVYQEYLKKHNLVDFDDLLLLVHELFETYPETLAKYQEYYQYILVDEFQDTNDIQYNIAKMIAGNKANLFVVGDDDQSIYSFRGANVGNIQLFQRHFPLTRIYLLEQNYRSTQYILDGSNRLIANNQKRQNKKLWSEDKGSSQDVLYFQGYDHSEEVDYVISKIREYYRNGYNYDEIAVLYRSNVISRNFELGLIQSRIPYKIYGGYSYLKRKEVKDALSYLRLIIDHNNMINFMRIINEPSRGIGDKTVARIIEEVNLKNITLFEAVYSLKDEFPKSKYKALQDFIYMIESLTTKINEMKLDEFFDEMIDQTNYLDSFEQDDNKEERIQNLSELKSVLIEIDKMHDESVTNLEKLQYAFDEVLLSESVQEQRNQPNDKSVTLSTIHSAKGLEFHIVFVVALEDEIFPNRYRVDEGETDIEEERRIAYVAVTRAKEKLVLTNAKNRLLFGRTMRHRPSQFLSEYATTQATITNQQIEKEPEIKVSQSGALRTGDRIIHKDFGEGIVISIDGTIVQILFHRDASLRKFLANYTSIKKI
jgi:DNA helicase II / ATP-dependent DNA helicase PcrA